VSLIKQTPSALLAAFPTPLTIAPTSAWIWELSLTSLIWFVSRRNVMLSTILIIILILLLIGALPTWPYSSGWGYYPGGGLGLILIIVIILVLMGRI
jgi:hypothetical protein